jgi:hypothetical protein
VNDPFARLPEVPSFGVTGTVPCWRADMGFDLGKCGACPGEPSRESTMPAATMAARLAAAAVFVRWAVPVGASLSRRGFRLRVSP